MAVNVEEHVIAIELASLNGADSVATKIKELASLNGADSVATKIKELASLNGADNVATEIEELASLNGADSVATEIEGLASSIEDTASNDPFMSPNCCIFKTPTVLYRLNEKAYVPDAFSIGPFHHGQPNLTDTEKIKIKYLHGLISRSPSPETILSDLFNSIKEVQTEARECYSKPIDYSPDELVKILVIDGCFIIELFRKKAYGQLIEDNDTIFTISCMHEFLYHDLILLENQVPWMVLQRLFNKTNYNPEHDMSLIKLAISFFEFIFSIITLPPRDHIIEDSIDIKHIPDLIIKWMVSSTEQAEQSQQMLSVGRETGRRPSMPRVASWKGTGAQLRRTKSKMFSYGGEEGWQHMPCATSLAEAGIKFKRVESKSILDIKFKDGFLEIPPLPIEEATETVFRNLISFEQCYPNCEARFTSYAVLIDNLINTAKDVDILCENKIIDNWLNPQDAVPFFNKLYHNTFCKEYYYQSLSREVNKYCLRWWPSWRAALVRNYFHTPWAIFSAMAAVILLILSLLQTVYSMKK